MADPAAAPRPPRIVVTFAGPGLADMTVSLDNVQHAQVYGAAWLLDTMAHELRAGQLAAQVQALTAVQSLGDLRRKV